MKLKSPQSDKIHLQKKNYQNHTGKLKLGAKREYLLLILLKDYLTEKRKAIRF